MRIRCRGIPRQSPQDETDGLLLVVDEEGTVSGGFLDRLRGTGALLVAHSVSETRERIETVACRAILVAVSGNPYDTLSLALCVHEMDPGLPVMVMSRGFKPRLIRLAERAGLRLLGKDDDVEVARAMDAKQLEPVVMLM